MRLDIGGYAVEVAAALACAGLAVNTGLTRRKIDAKVREHSLAVVARNAAENPVVAIRRLGGQAQDVLPLERAVARLASEAAPPDLISGKVA